MKTFTPDKIRNICLASHSGTGKTTLAEAMLFVSGTKKRFGSVDEGSTSSDFHPDEIERKFSINTSLMHCEWKGHKINILDTPGYADFRGEVRSAMRVADVVIIPIRATAMLDVGAEIAWNYAEEHILPVIFCVNELDKENSNFDQTFDVLMERFGDGRHIVEIGFPIGEGRPDFNKIFDIISMKLLKFELDKTGNYEALDVPSEFKERLNKLHEILIEDAAESEEEFMEDFFATGTLTDEEFKKGLREGIQGRKIVPVFCTDGINSVGIKPLLDFIVDYCPSPADMPSATGRTNTNAQEQRPNKSDAPFSALVFKTISENHVGELSLFRVYSGTVKSGDDVLNASKNVTERIGQVFLLNGKEREDAGQVGAGDIAALVKLKDTHTNNTLCDKSKPIVFGEIAFPDPVITFGIVPKGKADETKISQGLHTLHEEDPAFLYTYDVETQQSTVSGQGEMHLTIITRRLKERFGVEVDLVDPKIPYKETIRGAVKDAEFKHKKQSGGRGQYGHVHIKLSPKQRGSGFEFIDEVVGGVVPGRFIPAVEKGVVEAMTGGVVAGYPVVDVAVTLYDGSYHDVDSDELSFKIAGAQAFRKGFKEGHPIILEPIYEVEITIPEEYLGAIMGDISSRRGQILGMEADGHFQIVKAQLPLAEILKYATILRSMTSGRGMFRKKFDHYAEVPHEQAAKLMKEYEERKAAGNG
ncbi:MAG TPA: elongation factor G [bacterium]|nr:elongation factor G [bacterium]